MQAPSRFGARGVNGAVLVAAESVVVRRKRPLLMIMSQGLRRTTETEIAVAEIADVRFKPATAFVNGYLAFTRTGDPPPRGGGLDAAQDPQAVMFTKKQQPAFEAARRLVDGYRKAASPSAAATAADG